MPFIRTEDSLRNAIPEKEKQIEYLSCMGPSTRICIESGLVALLNRITFCDTATLVDANYLFRVRQ